jgi:hypothetical protein
MVCIQATLKLRLDTYPLLQEEAHIRSALASTLYGLPTIGSRECKGGDTTVKSTGANTARVGS